MPKKLLIVMHCPSPNTKKIRDALISGATQVSESGIRVLSKGPFETEPADVLGADGLILGTTENFGYMSGALKDFFDRAYYPCLEATQGKPVAVVIRAGNDGTGAARSMQPMLKGLGWKLVQEPLIYRGEFEEAFVTQSLELGMAFSAGLEAGIF